MFALYISIAFQLIIENGDINSKFQLNTMKLIIFIIPYIYRFITAPPVIFIQNMLNPYFIITPCFPSKLSLVFTSYFFHIAPLQRHDVFNRVR